MKKFTKLMPLAAAMTVALAAFQPARADVTFAAASGDLAAQAAFSLIEGGGTLQVVLTNTSSVDVNDASGVLLGRICPVCIVILIYDRFFPSRDSYVAYIERLRSSI